MQEVHLRIGAPPITHPDFYGIDTPDQINCWRQIIRWKKCAPILVRQPRFLSVDGLYRAMGYEDGRDPVRPQFTDHCFTGDYPTGLTDQQDDGQVKQLSLLAEQA